MESSVVNTSSRLEKLLEDFRRIRGPSSSPATFLETAGYPHFENVASNILEFFLDPTEEHGLGTLFLEALLAPLALERLSFQGVTREAGTENGKRIDLVIECETHVIGVENKVFASVYNPLDDYRAHLRKEAGDREAVLMLLCFREPPIGAVPPDIAVVTYEQLMGRVRQNLGRHAADAPAQYLTFALDFVKTMENLRKRNRMNPAVLGLFTEKKDEVIEFLHALREVTKELRGIVGRTGEIVTETLPDGLPQQVHKWFYREERNLLDDLVHDVEFPSGANVAIDAHVSLDGWEVVVWQRRSSLEKLPVRDFLSGFASAARRTLLSRARWSLRRRVALLRRSSRSKLHWRRLRRTRLRWWRRPRGLRWHRGSRRGCGRLRGTRGCVGVPAPRRHSCGRALTQCPCRRRRLPRLHSVQACHGG